MLKFNILVGGAHKAIVTADLDGQGAFAGTIDSQEFGNGVIRDGTQEGDQLKGIVTLDGHDAQFSAEIAGDTIRGSLRSGWFFRMAFTGLRIT